MRFPIGIMLESFRCDTRAAMDMAAAMGVSGVQMYATSGENAPQNLTASDRRALLRMANDRGLRFSALCGDLGMGFGDPQRNSGLIARSLEILQLAAELNCGIVTTHIGVVPADPKHPRYGIMQDACGKLAEHARELGSYFAIETGPETAATLKHFLDGIGSRGIAVNMDPANLVMVTGDDPVEAVYTLREYIVHTHAKDGIKRKDGDPEVLYGVRKIEEVIRSADYFQELPLGQGDVPFQRYMTALEQIGYKGFLTIEREVGNHPLEDIGLAVDYLKSFMTK